MYQKSVCKVTVPKVCSEGLYSMYESRYLYSLGEYKCLLLIVYLKMSLIYMKYIYILSQHLKPNFHAKKYNIYKFTINNSLFKLNYNWRHCSAISLTVVMCVCTKRVPVFPVKHSEYWTYMYCTCCTQNRIHIWY